MNFLAFEDGPISMLEALNVSVTGIVVVMIILAFLAVLVILLSKGIRAVSKDTKNSDEIKRDAAPAEVKSEVSAPAAKKGSALPENQSVGNLDLYKTDEKTAAIIMAIISNESGISLNKLQFNSIKLIEE